MARKKVKLNICRYRWKWLKTKSMLLMLFWGFTSSFTFNYILLQFLYFKKNKHRWHVYGGACLAVIFPLAGLITDIRIGRYKCIKVSLYLTMVGAFFMALFGSLEEFHVHGFFDASLVVAVIGLFVFLLSYIQFCLDQLTDASSGEIVSFICVYVWTYFASSVAVQILHYTMHSLNHSSLSILALPTLWAISACIDSLFHHTFVKEPIGCNPLMLIFKVFMYALKTKHPHLRSAFTYWEDKPYSRIDLAKVKYGGPFTTEQVEDVKTFFRIATLIGLGAIFFAALDACDVLSFIFYNNNMLREEASSNSVKIKIFMLLNGGDVGIVLIYPIYELFLIIVLYRCIQRITILKRVVAGMALMLLGLVQFTALGMGKDFFTNETIACASSVSIPLGNPIAYYYSIFKVLECSGKFILIVAGIEFICAQAPYSMKGLLFGSAFSSTCLSAVIMYSILLPFHVVHKHDSGVSVQCIFWYFLCSTLLAGVVFILFLVASYCYKPRIREDTLPNQQCFAEQYYESIYNVAEH